MNITKLIEDSKNYIESNDLDSAQDILNKVLSVKKNNTEAAFLSGIIEHKKFNFTKAESLYKKVIKKDKNHFGARMNLAAALGELNKNKEALEQLNLCAKHNPGDYQVFYNLGNIYKASKYYKEAIKAYEKAILLNPGFSNSYNNLGSVYMEKENHDLAVKNFEHAISLSDLPSSYSNIILLTQRKNPRKAYDYALQVINKKIKGDALVSAYCLFMDTCRYDLIDRVQDEVLLYAKSCKVTPTVLGDLLLRSIANPVLDNKTIYDLHLNYWELKKSGLGLPYHSHSRSLQQTDKLRIGYISPDFRQHSVGHFIRNILKNHNSNRFEVYCYSTSHVKDYITEEIIDSSDHFVNVKNIKDVSGLAELIHNDGIQILIDLAGCTTGNALAAFYLKPSPVQITYLGYPNTTGLSAMDYRITDHNAEIDGGTIYTEKLLYMPESFLCFGSFQDRVIEKEPAVIRKQYITFGSFNNIRKITKDVIRIWSKILNDVPRSIIIIKASDASRDYIKENIHKCFAQYGITKDRVDMRGFVDAKGSHLDLYNEIDIALDTFPYNGATTTCEALWMGVPVITLVGKAHAQRVSYTLLKNIGIEETITYSEDEYIRQATDLAQDVSKLKCLRERIPDAVRKSILCKPEKFTRQLEELYMQAWIEKGYSLPEMFHTNSKQEMEAGNSNRYKIESELARAREFLEDRNIDAAKNIVLKAMDEEPENIKVQFLLGTIAYENMDYTESIRLLQLVTDKAPKLTSARLNLAAALGKQHQWELAENNYKIVLEDEPDNYTALANLGRLYLLHEKYNEAQTVLEKSINIYPDNRNAHINLGDVFSTISEHMRAAVCYQNAIDIEYDPAVTAKVIRELMFVHEIDEAYKKCQYLIEKKEDSVHLISVVNVFYDTHDWRTIADLKDSIIDIFNNPEVSAQIKQITLLLLNYHNDVDIKEVKSAHDSWGKMIIKSSNPYNKYNIDTSSIRKIRIGYLSADFKTHSVGHFIRNIISNHNKNYFDIYCYSSSDSSDKITDEIKESASKFVDVRRMSDEEVALNIHNDGIHILIELAGHTSGTRITALGNKPAPIQITYLGYPNTTGLPTIDYRITDHNAEVAGGTLYSEELLYMPESFLCFGSFPDRPIEAEPPVKRLGHITFGSFNNIRKITPDVVRVWSKILNSIPKSRLILKTIDANKEIVQKNIYRDFAQHGIERERLDLRGIIKSEEVHLDFYNQIDVALDTFPYNGATTTAEALWMGVPVVTLVGKVHAQRVSYTLLKNIGVEDTITHTEEEYINKAVDLASNITTLHGLRNKIPGAIRNSILCNPGRFTRQLENLYLDACGRKGLKVSGELMSYKNNSMPVSNKININAELDRAKILLEERDRKTAKTIVKNILDIEPDNLNAMFLLGTIAYEDMEFGESIDILDYVIKKMPDLINARLNIGAAMMETGDYDGAVSHYKYILSKEPGHYLALNNLGNIYKKLRRYDDAITFLEKSIKEKPDNWIAYYNLGNIYAAEKNHEEAIKYYKKSISIQPELNTYASLISANNVIHNYEEAYHIALDALNVDNKNEALLAVRGTFYNAHDWQAIKETSDDALKLLKNPFAREKYLSSALLSFNSNWDIDRQDIFDAHCNWGRIVSKSCDPYNEYEQAFSVAESKTHKIRVGYMSPDFRRHAVGYFMRNIFSHHDASHLEIYCYSNTDDEDEITSEIMSSVYSFNNINNMSDQEVAQKIYNDGINILVDLSGHTCESRMAVMRYKPAPVQITYLGYPNTTGLLSVDYRITDHNAETEEGTLYTEELLYMPESFLCFGSFDERPIEAEPPVKRNGYITFGSFNSIRKITPEVVRIWSEILKRVPDSKLVIKSGTLEQVFVQDNIYDDFAQYGINRQQVELRGMVRTTEEHLDSYNQIDIALDTFPYSGATTTCDALWMGVPVITLVGSAHVQRVSCTILKNIGIENTVTYTEEEYINTAIQLATNITGLHELRKHIPDAIRDSILCDPERFTRQIENIYINAWNRKYPDRSIEIDGDVSIENRIPDEVTPKTLNVSLRGIEHIYIPYNIQQLTPYVLLEQEDWFTGELDFTQKLVQKDAQIIDLGSQYGVMALAFSCQLKSSGSVYVLNDIDEQKIYLSENIETNRLSNIKISNADRETNLEHLHKQYNWKNTSLIYINPDIISHQTARNNNTFFNNTSAVLMIAMDMPEQAGEIISELKKQGYQLYQLLPMLGVLSALSEDRVPVTGGYSLFLCKPDKAKMLQTEGLIINQQGASALQTPDPVMWIEYLQRFPYVIRLSDQWVTYMETHHGDDAWQIHQHALGLYVLAQLAGSTQKTYDYLYRAYQLLADLISQNANLSNLQTFIRIAIELGRHHDAVNAIRHILEISGGKISGSPDEPFLAVSHAFEEIDPGGEVINWLYCALMEQQEKLQAASSWFTGKASLDNLERLKSLGFQTTEMERRRQLIRIRYHIQETPEAQEILSPSSNSIFWGGTIEQESHSEEKSIAQQETTTL